MDFFLWSRGLASFVRNGVDDVGEGGGKYDAESWERSGGATATATMEQRHGE